MARYRKVRKEMKLLPRKGYKCITVTDSLHQDIKKRAQQTNLTIKEYIEQLMAKEKTKEGH